VINLKIELAGFVFEINTMYIDTKQLCENYLSTKDKDFLIEINTDDLKFEQEKSIKEAIYEGIAPVKYSDGYLETIAVYRKIAEILPTYNATVFHGALISLNNEGYLFTGRSGIGKTTHINNWLKEYKDTRIINGDKPILKIVNNELIGYGTPWSGKENLNTNDSVKIKAIIILEQDKTNHIEQLNIKDAYTTLLSQTYRTSKPDGVKQALELSLKMAGLIKVYRLGCNMDQQSAKVAYEGINK